MDCQRKLPRAQPDAEHRGTPDGRTAEAAAGMAQAVGIQETGRTGDHVTHSRSATCTD